MSENIVEQVRAIEAEADRIVAEARRRAEELESSVPAQAAAARKEREEALRRDVEAMEGELRRQADERLEEVSIRAQAAGEQLDALDEGAIAQAVGRIVSHLRGKA